VQLPWLEQVDRAATAAAAAGGAVGARSGVGAGPAGRRASAVGAGEVPSEFRLPEGRSHAALVC